MVVGVILLGNLMVVGSEMEIFVVACVIRSGVEQQLFDLIYILRAPTRPCKTTISATRDLFVGVALISRSNKQLPLSFFIK